MTGSARRRIVYVQYANPAAYPPIEHSSHLLADEGWSVLMLGMIQPHARGLRLHSHPRITERYLFTDSTGWRLKLHYLWFSAWAVTWTLRWRARWAYASDILSCPVAVLLSCLPGVSVLYHEHDEPTARNGFSMRLQTVLRRCAAVRARLRVLPNAQRACLFEKTVSHRKPIMIVWNCPRLDELSAEPRFNADGNLRLVYSGSITPERLPLSILTALKAAPEGVALRLVGYDTAGSPGYTQALERRARELGIEHRLELIPAVPRHQLQQLWADSDVGLALGSMKPVDNNNRWLVGASNKPFDYMAAGLVLLVPDLTDWRETFVDPGYGLACNPDDPMSIVAALHWLAAHPAERRAMGERGRRQILTAWNYEAQFRPVLQRLTEAHGSLVRGPSTCITRPPTRTEA